MARTSEGPKLRRVHGRNSYSVRFTHQGQRVELSAGTSDPEVAAANAEALYERVTGGTRYLHPRGLSLPRWRALGVVPMVLAPAVSGVYFAWCPLLPQFVKIGSSRNVRRRIRHFSTGLPGPLYVLAIHPGSKAEELALHRQLQSSRVHGEWFRADASVVSAIRGRTSANSGTLSG